LEELHAVPLLESKTSADIIFAHLRSKRLFSLPEATKSAVVDNDVDTK
jgi:hypothetical protein